MKKLVFAALAATTTFVAAPAFAQAPNNNGVVGNVVMNLSADVSTICGAVDFLNPVPVNFNDLSTVATSATVTRSNGLSIICNDADGGTVTVTSANGGQLRRNGTLTGAGNVIPYTFGATGGSGLAIPAGSSLASPVARTFSGSTAYMAGQSMTLNFTTNGVLESNVGSVNEGERTTVFAGNYTDTVTVSVTAN
jgi:spore coat protein U-like protein